jgi:drug/metabolite transporter (DMT)-like permease
MGAIWLGEPVTALQIAGTAVVIAGIAVLGLKRT